MSIQEIFEVMVYPDPRIAKLLANPEYREGIENFIQEDMGGDVENLITAAYNRFGTYEDVEKDEREEYICMILTYLCNYLDIDQSEIMDDAIIPTQSKDIVMPPLGVSFSDEYEQEPDHEDENNIYNSEEPRSDDNIGESSQYAEDIENTNPDDDADDELPPHGDDDMDEGLGDFPSGNEDDNDENYEEPSYTDSYNEPGDGDEPDWEDSKTIESHPAPVIIKEEAKEEQPKVDKKPILKTEDKKEEQIVQEDRAAHKEENSTKESAPKEPAVQKTTFNVEPKVQKPVEAQKAPEKVVQASKQESERPKVVEKIIEKVIIHNAPKREFRLYEETDDFLREIDEESVKDEDDIDINLLWNMLNDMYIWRRRVEKKILNIESRLPQVGTLDIGKMYKVFPDHIEIYKSSRLIKSITNRFIDFDQDTFATGLIGNTVQYNGKIWGVGISENINISRDYAIYNFATNPETMEKVLREFIKGL